MNQALTTNKRIESIDILRGIVMIIMALVHVRDFTHITAVTQDPLDLQTTTPILFFTRFITHFCAPIFVFLSGTSAYLQSQRKTKNELSSFLMKRGLWLIFAEIFIVSFGVTFIPFNHFIMLQVIWSIGISMVILGLLIHLRFNMILILGLIIVFGHNLLDILESAAGFKSNIWWDLIHRQSFHQYAKDRWLFIMYPFVPWTGLMLLGYCTGKFFSSEFTVEQRRKILIRLGIGILLFFVVLRFSNVYGNPIPWSFQRNGLYTFLSFINVYKYPPSLLYMCITIGPALLFLAWIENMQNRFTGIMRVYGRTAFFYYLIHFYLAHSICAVLFFSRGHSINDALQAVKQNPFLFQIPGEGYSLSIVYLVWALLVISLYPLCKWYDVYKTVHKEKWWLSYL